MLLKYDASGKLKYRYILTTSLYDAFKSVSFDSKGNALVARIPAPVVGGGPLQVEKIWRLDGPASGLDHFRGMLVQPGNGIFACGTERAGDLEWRGVVQRIQS